MQGRKSYRKRVSDLGLAIVLSAGLFQSQPFSARSVRADDQCEAKPIVPDLVTAIRDADVQAVRKLIEKGADVNARDAEGNTPLILASFYASPECVALLLEKGADANAANKAGVTALVRAATNYEKTRLLVDAGAQVRVRTADLGNTPLILAARRAGNSRTVQMLLERGASATERNNAGISPILTGAASGDLETVQFLLAAGAKADDFPKSNDPRATALVAGFRTPLMWAAYSNDQRSWRSPPAGTRRRSESVDLFRHPVVAGLLERRLRGGGVVDRPRRERSQRHRDCRGGLHAVAVGRGKRNAPPPIGPTASGQRRRSECGGRRTRGRAWTGAADPAVDRREARPDGHCRRARGRRCQGSANAGENRHAETCSTGRARSFDNNHFGREGGGGVASDRGQIARGVPPARQQTRLRLVPPAVLADGRRRPRP